MKIRPILLVFGLVVVGAFVYRYRSSRLSPSVEFEMGCPVPQEFCSSAREVSGGESFGFSLPEGTEIRSPLDGRLSIGTLKASKTSKSAHFVWVAPSLEDKDAFSVLLIFDGEVSNPKRGGVVSGQKVGSSGDSLEAYDGMNLAVQVYRGGTSVSNSLLYLKTAR